MRKLLFIFTAAVLVASCSNLKKKSKDNTDDTETTTKDKTNTDDDKKKKDVDITDDNAPKDHKKTDDDTKMNNNGSWSNSDESKFMDECTGTAAKNVGMARAKQYCSCMMGKAEKVFSSYTDANQNMSSTQLNNWAADCNNQ